MIDFCVVVLDSDKAKARFRKSSMTEVVREIFGCGLHIVVGALREQQFNFYQRSATMIDSTGSVAGKVGLRDDGAIQISLSGQGCNHVPNWPHVADVLDALDARISHVDIAVDDLTGETFNLDLFRDLYHQGEFTMSGRPPKAQYISDEGSRAGCSFYVGQRGHKQLNVYEKGKQLGDPDSPHVRCELRLYAKRIDLPNDVLRNPGKYFGGAYPMLVAFVVGEIERMGLHDQIVNSSVVAFKRFMRTQCGTGVQLVIDALGDDAWEFIQEHFARHGRPGRFKNVTGDLNAHIRAQLTAPIQEAIA